MSRGVGNRGRSTTGERAVPEHYPTTPDREAAAYLRLTVARYLSQRANRAEVNEAYRMFAATACTCREGTPGVRCASTGAWVSVACAVHGR